MGKPPTPLRVLEETCPTCKGRGVIVRDHPTVRMTISDLEQAVPQTLPTPMRPTPLAEPPFEPTPAPGPKLMKVKPYDDERWQDWIVIVAALAIVVGLLTFALVTVSR
jgi:hypothetical protein